MKVCRLPILEFLINEPKRAVNISESTARIPLSRIVSCVYGAHIPLTRLDTTSSTTCVDCVRFLFVMLYTTSLREVDAVDFSLVSE